MLHSIAQAADILSVAATVTFEIWYQVFKILSTEELHRKITHYKKRKIKRIPYGHSPTKKESTEIFQYPHKLFNNISKKNYAFVWVDEKIAKKLTYFTRFKLCYGVSGIPIWRKQLKFLVLCDDNKITSASLFPWAWMESTSCLLVGGDVDIVNLVGQRWCCLQIQLLYQKVFG